MPFVGGTYTDRTEITQKNYLLHPAVFKVFNFGYVNYMYYLFIISFITFTIIQLLFFVFRINLLVQFCYCHPN